MHIRSYVWIHEYIFCIIFSLVLIVYFVDKNVGNKNRIQILSKILRYCGIDCNIDQYFETENILSWPQWISQQIKSCISKGGYILLECSEITYDMLENSFNPTIKMPVAKIDCQTIRHYLRDNTNSFLPFCIDEDLSHFVPIMLSEKTFYIFHFNKLPKLFTSGDFTEDDVSELLKNNPEFNSLRRLVATVTNQPDIKPGIKPIGKVLTLCINTVYIMQHVVLNLCSIRPIVQLSMCSINSPPKTVKIKRS